MITSSFSGPTRTFLSLIVILPLLHKNKIYVYGFPTETCSEPDKMYIHNGVCCYMCPPGNRVASHCRSQPNDGSCQPCESGYYQDDLNSQTDCVKVKLCDKRHERVVEEPNKNGTSDRTCACDDGYEYSGSGERCRKADPPVGLPSPPSVGLPSPSFITDVTTTVTHPSSPRSSLLKTSSPSQPPPPTGGKISSAENDKQTIYILVGVLCLVILLVLLGILVLALCYCRKKKTFCFKQREDRKPIASIAYGLSDTRQPGHTETDPMMLNSSSTTELNSQTLSQNGGHQISAGNGDISSHANGSIALGISATQCGERELMVPNPTNTVTPLSQSQNEEEGHEMKARNGDIPSRANGHCNGEVRAISTQSRAPQHKRKSDRGDAAGPRCMSEENESKLRELKPKLAEDMPYQQVLDRMSTVFTREDEADIKKEIHSDFDKRRKLIDILIMKDNSAFGKFVRVLEKVSPHLAKALKEEQSQA